MSNQHRQTYLVLAFCWALVILVALVNPPADVASWTLLPICLLTLVVAW